MDMKLRFAASKRKRTKEFELSILKILDIQDCSLPFASIVLGQSSFSKTLGIELLEAVVTFIIRTTLVQRRLYLIALL